MAARTKRGRKLPRRLFSLQIVNAPGWRLVGAISGERNDYPLISMTPQSPASEPNAMR